VSARRKEDTAETWRVEREKRVSLGIHATSVEVERRGRFKYVVVERWSSGLDGSWSPPHWFRWTAGRHARRLARELTRPDPEFEVVLTLPIARSEQP
jgi:hypothetical protein